MAGQGVIAPLCLFSLPTVSASHPPERETGRLLGSGEGGGGRLPARSDAYELFGPEQAH